MYKKTYLWSTLYDSPQSLNNALVLPGEEEEKEPLPWGRLVSGAEVGVDLQSEQQEPETHEEYRKDQLVPERHTQSKQPVHFHHLGDRGERHMDVYGKKYEQNNIKMTSSQRRPHNSFVTWASSL